MRIGIDIRAIGNQRTGDETYTLQLVRALAKLDKVNTYFLYTDTFSKEKLLVIKKLLSLQNDNFKIISVGPTAKLFWTFYSLVRQVKKDKLDILHLQYIVPFFLTKKVKIITTIHDVSFARYPEFISKKDLFILRMFITLSLRRADKIIAVSKFTKKELKDVYDVSESKLIMIYNGGVTEEFKKKIKNEEVLKFKKEYDILEPYLLYLGTLQPRKNIPFLIKSFVALKLKYSQKYKLIEDLNLVIRGSRNGHNYDKKIDTLLGKIKNRYPEIYKSIKFLDYISNKDLPLLFKGAEVFCFPSLYEGFGLPLLEAMSVGTPVIANDSSCFSEIVGDGGVIYKSDNFGDFLKNILKLLTDENFKEELKRRGQERVSYFSWEKNAQETIKLYNQLN